MEAKGSDPACWLNEGVDDETIEKHIIDLITVIFPKIGKQDRFREYTLNGLLNKYQGRELQLYYVLCEDLDISPMQYMDIVRMAKDRKRGKKRTEEADDPQRGRLEPPEYGLAAKADPAKRPGEDNPSPRPARRQHQASLLHLRRQVLCLVTP